MVLFVLAISLRSASAAVPGYKAKGRLFVTRFLADGSTNAGFSSIHDFVVTYDKSFTRYRFDYNSGADAPLWNKGPGKVFLCSDSTNLYYLHFMTRNGVVVPDNSNILEVVPGSFPFFDYAVMDIQAFLWTCLGSKQFLSTLGTPGFPIPWRTPRVSPEAYGFAVENVSRLDGSGLVKAFRIVRRASLDLSPEKEASRPEIDPPQTPAFRQSFDDSLARRLTNNPEGFLLASYSVESTLTVDSQAIPKRFVLTIFRPDGNKQAHGEIVGEISGVEEIGEAELEWPRLADLSVRDQRWRNFKNGNHVYNLIYPLERGQKLPETHDFFRNHAYRSLLKPEPMDVVKRARTMARFRLVAAGVSFGGAAIIVGGLIRRRRPGHGPTAG